MLHPNLFAPHTAGMLLKVSMQLSSAVCQKEKTLFALLIPHSSLHTYFDKVQLFSFQCITNHLSPEGREAGTFARLMDAKPRVKSDSAACPILLGMQ